jgi:hypothetical protein
MHGHTNVTYKKKEERDYFGDLGVDGRIILKRILKTWNLGVWIGIVWLRVGTWGDFFEHGNEPSFSKTH